MKTYESDVYLRNVNAITDDQADALFNAGCDDGTPVSSAGTAWIHFHREAALLDDAIRLAIAQVRSVGMDVFKVEIDAASGALQIA